MLAIFRRRPAHRPAPPRPPLRVECLEDRTTPATYATHIDLVSSANPSAPGAAVTFTATLSATSVFGSFTPPPGATILVSADGGPVGSGTTDFLGTVSVTTSTLGAGSHTILATFLGGSPNGFDNYLLSTATLTQVVGSSSSPPPASPSSFVPNPVRVHVSAEGARPGAPGTLTALNPDGTTRFSDQPFTAAFTGGVRVAVGDVNGDGVEDVVAAAGPGGGPAVKVYDGNDSSVLYTFMAYESSFTGGVYVAVGDLNGDGRADIVTSPDEGGGPRVRVFSGADLSPLADFLGIDDPNFRGGARVALGDVTADGRPDLVVSAGFGGGPRVAVFDGATVLSARDRVANDFFAFEPELRNGCYVAVGDVNGDRSGDLIFGGGPGGAPRVRVISGKDIYQGGGQTEIVNFFAGDVNSRHGVFVAAGDADGDGNDEIIAVPPVGITGSDGGVYDRQGSYLPGFRAPAGFFTGIPVKGSDSTGGQTNPPPELDLRPLIKTWVGRAVDGTGDPSTEATLVITPDGNGTIRGTLTITSNNNFEVVGTGSYAGATVSTVRFSNGRDGLRASSNAQGAFRTGDGLANLARLGFEFKLDPATGVMDMTDGFGRRYLLR